VYLYHPAVQALKAALNPQELGLVQYLDLARVNPGPPEPKHSVLWDLAPHEVSLAVDLAQKKPISVRATGMRWDHRVFEAANLEIKFSGGILARIHASWRGHLKVRRLDAYCEKGMASFDEMAPNQLKLVYPGQDNRIGAGDQFSGTLTYGEPRIDIPVLPSAKPLNAECADFISSLNKGHDPRSGADLGVCVVRILEAAERSAKLRGQEIRL
jgi:predicted dehydrogenase